MSLPRFTRVAPTVSLFAFLALLPGCGPPAAPRPSEAAQAVKTTPNRSVKEYKLVGVVNDVDPKKGRVTIRHEKIPGFMDAMTMPFTPKNPRDLDDVRPGDGVEATLRVETEGGEVKDYELNDLVVTNPAPAKPLTLRLAGGQPRLDRQPVMLKPGDAVPDFSMTDEDGATRKLSDFRGNVVALTFIYTRCPLPDFCPRIDRKFSELAARVGAVRSRAERVRLLSVSFDPEHDTAAALKAHARGLGAEPPLWTFAVAPHDELAKVARPLGLVYGPSRGEVIHNLVIAVIDPDGKLVRLETGDDARSWDVADLIKSMYSRLPNTKK